MGKERVIFSNRFDRPTLEQIEEEMKKENYDDNENLMSAEEFLDFMKKNRRTIPNERRIANKDKFIWAVRELSETYEIDADLIEDDDGYTAFAVVIGISASGIIDEIHIGFFSYGCKGCRCPNAHKSSKAHNRRQHKRDGFLEFCFNHCVFLLEMQKRTDVTQCVRLKLFCFSSSRYRCCTPYRIAFLSISTQR